MRHVQLPPSVFGDIVSKHLLVLPTRLPCRSQAFALILHSLGLCSQWLRQDLPAVPTQRGTQRHLHCSRVCSPWLGSFSGPSPLHTAVRGPREPHGHVLECWAGGEPRCQARLREACFKDTGRTCAQPGPTVISTMLGSQASLGLPNPSPPVLHAIDHKGLTIKGMDRSDPDTGFLPIEVSAL